MPIKINLDKKKKVDESNKHDKMEKLKGIWIALT